MNLTTVSKESMDKMTGPALIALHNEAAALLGEGTVKRFATKADAIRRTWAKVDAARVKAPAPAPKAAPAAPAPAAQPEVQAPVQRATPAARPKAAAKPAKPKKRRGTNLLPTGEPVEPCRAGSKQAILVDMLSRKDGASMAELLDGLSGGRKPWTEPTVRSGFGWDLKQKGYGVRSRFLPDGSERFYLVLPAGERIPGHIGSTDGKLARKGTPPKARAKQPAAAAPQVAASRRA